MELVIRGPVVLAGHKLATCPRPSSKPPFFHLRNEAMLSSDPEEFP
jgi:hypothetical protein